MNSCSTSAPESGSVAGVPALEAGSLLEAPVPEAEEADEEGAEAEAEAAWFTPATPAPDGVDAEVAPLAGAAWVVTGNTTTTGPRPAALTARTRMAGLTVPTLSPAMWQEPGPGLSETQVELPV
jgi:hypothetical protein